MTTTQDRHSNDSVPPLDYIFHPKAMAVVGLSNDPEKAWLSQCYVTPMRQMGFAGPLYVINPKGGQIGGLPAYPSLRDVPGAVDYVVSLVPARHTPQLLADCAAKGVKVVQFYTAGFAETGEAQDTELQERLVETARRSGIRLVGPNCMGIYYPRWGLGFCPDFPKEPGSIGLLCQSGGNTGHIVRSVAARGLRFSKVVSYGNACDINERDILDYLADDDETKVIAAYIEGTRDGRRLRQCLARAVSRKPVVILKGGCTTAGVRAAVTHTASLAGADAAWNALLRQVGAIRVDGVEEMADMLVAILQMRLPRGLNTCVGGIGGGSNVLATDDCEKIGLSMPPLPPPIAERVRRIIPRAGAMLRNPIDAFPLIGLPQGWRELIDVLHDWEGLDLVLFQNALGTPPLPPTYESIAPAVGPMLAAVAECRLPFALVWHSITNDASWHSAQKVEEMCVGKGLPFFVSMRGAALAMRRIVAFQSSGRTLPGVA
ncbi:MAG: CoA-binding protein [Chloroflexi bacterium]|nr:CoA-binding protein [Chloroflexota bacterium]